MSALVLPAPPRIVRPDYLPVYELVRLPRWARPWERTKDDAAVEALSVLHSAQSAGAANAATVAITAATAGNILVTMMSQTGLNVPTASGFTINATSAVYNTSLSSVWVGYKIAAGGETAATWVAGSGGTAHGVCCWEIAGGPNAIWLDGAVIHTDNIASGTAATITPQAIVPGSIILMGVGSDTSTGTITAWTGTNVATNISTAAARCFGGSFITTTPVNSAFTGNWTTAHVSGMLEIALRPTAPSLVARSRQRFRPGARRW